TVGNEAMYNVTDTVSNENTVGNETIYNLTDTVSNEAIYNLTDTVSNEAIYNLINARPLKPPAYQFRYKNFSVTGSLKHPESSYPGYRYNRFTEAPRKFTSRIALNRFTKTPRKFTSRIAYNRFTETPRKFKSRIATQGFYINRVQAVISNTPGLIFLSTTPDIFGNQVGNTSLSTKLEGPLIHHRATMLVRAGPLLTLLTMVTMAVSAQSQG
ncbi:hypothetical protein RRG08_046686, partial [Elysia crispata]